MMLQSMISLIAYLPACSADFNPWRMHPQSFKALLRKAAERTVDGLWTAIGTFIDLFKPPGVCQRLRRRTIRSDQAAPDLATAIVWAGLCLSRPRPSGSD